MVRPIPQGSFCGDRGHERSPVGVRRYRNTRRRKVGSHIKAERPDKDAADMHARILDAAEALLRRHGLAKLTVVDVARVLKMSHGNVYRHVDSKAALRAEVIRRWLDRVSDQTETIASEVGPSDIRLRAWLTGLAVIKQRKVSEDAEMLAAAIEVLGDAPDVMAEHSARLTTQLAGILEDGRIDGTLAAVGDPTSTARAILDATYRFHHPNLVAVGGPAEAQLVALNRVVDLVLPALTGKRAIV